MSLQHPQKRILENFVVIWLDQSINESDADFSCNITIIEDTRTKMMPLPRTNTPTSNTRAIRMWDIPQNFTKKDIHNSLTHLGPLESITVTNRTPWLSAIITFKLQADYEKAINEWSIFYKENNMILLLN